jgi:hypothetical protein
MSRSSIRSTGTVGLAGRVCTTDRHPAPAHGSCTQLCWPQLITQQCRTEEFYLQIAAGYHLFSAGQPPKSSEGLIIVTMWG